MGKVKKKAMSELGWETSDFGGFERVLYDLPDVNYPFGFRFLSSPDLHYLSYYNRSKLLGTFFLKAKEHSLLKTLVDGAEFSEEKITSFGYTRTNPSIVLKKENVKAVLNKVIEKENTIKALFIHFANAIANSKLGYELTYSEEMVVSEGSISNNDLLIGKLSNVEERTIYRYIGSTVSGSNLARLRALLKTKIFDPREEECEFSKSEAHFGDTLVKMLDISFEKQASKITSLRTGKIDQPRLAEVVCGNTLVHFRREILERTRPFTVVILCDESGSMAGRKLFWQFSLVKSLYYAFSQILPDDKIFVYGHTGGSEPVVRVYQDKFNPNFLTTINNMTVNYLGQNYDGPVIENVHEKVRNQTDDNIIFITLSDGQPAGDNYGGPNDYADMRRIIEKCRRDGFITIGLGIQHFSVKDLYKYNMIIQDLKDPNVPMQICMLINNVVKTEFKD